MSPEQAGAIVKQVLGAYPAQRQRMTSDDVVGLTVSWIQDLADVDHAIGKAALSRLLRSSKFVPTIAEFREACVDVAGGRRKNGGEAWGEVLALIRRHGSHRWPGQDFEIADPLIAAAVRSFGWRDLCASENAVADRARFIELYDQLAKADRKEIAIARGAGSTMSLPSGTRPRLAVVDDPDPHGAKRLVADLAKTLTAKVGPKEPTP